MIALGMAGDRPPPYGGTVLFRFSFVGEAPNVTKMLHSVTFLVGFYALQLGRCFGAKTRVNWGSFRVLGFGFSGVGEVFGKIAKMFCVTFLVGF